MSSVQIVEVGPRDGFQSVTSFIGTDIKIRILQALYSTGVRRIEATSFVSPQAVPQLSDAAEIVAAANALPGLDAQILVPTANQATRAIQAGARHLAFVLSVSEEHNRSNVRRSPADSVAEYVRIVAVLPAGIKLRLNVATAFDCPYRGRVDMRATLALLGSLIPHSSAAEIALCDTTGRVMPDQVRRLFSEAFNRFPQVSRWAFHAHDTYGLGAANVFEAWNVGIRVFDSSAAGLGGCPFAPGATGNVATEDLVWMFEGMGIETGIDLDALVVVAEEIARLPAAQTGGRVRKALSARRSISTKVQG